MARRAPAWIDVTVAFGHPAATFPGDEPLRVTWSARLGDPGPIGVNLSCITSSPHNGTHADAPYHVLADGRTSEALPLDAFVGPCLVVDATLATGTVGASHVRPALEANAERVLFKTRHGGVPSAFPPDFVGLEPALVERLVAAGVRLVGTDAPSIDGPGADGLAAHRALFRGGGYNLESLDLSRVEPGAYELHAAPLKVAGLCAAPVRALLRPLP